MCKDGWYRNLQGRCVPKTQCDKPCGNVKKSINPGDNCPVQKLNSHVGSTYVLTTQDESINLAAFEITSNAEHQIFEVTVRADLKISIQQNQINKNLPNSGNDFKYNYRIKRSSAGIDQLTSEVSTFYDVNQKVEIVVENQSWVDLKIKSLDVSRNLVDKTTTLNDRPFLSDSAEKELTDIVHHNNGQLYVEEDNLNDSQQSESNIIGCTNIRGDPCEYQEHNIQGWKVYTQIGGDFSQVLQALDEDLALFKSNYLAVNNHHHKQKQNIKIFQTVKIYLNDGIIFGEENSTHEWQGAIFYSDKSWLENNNNMPEEKFEAIEFFTTNDYLDGRHLRGILGFDSFGMAKTTNWQITHELAHFYHFYLHNYDNIQPADNEIEKVFNHAINTLELEYNASGNQLSEDEIADNKLLNKKLYEEVERFDGSLVPSYAQMNSKEYFAALSSAYLSLSNDYAPFNKHQLEKYDELGYLMMKKYWSLSKNEVTKMHNENKKL